MRVEIILLAQIHVIKSLQMCTQEVQSGMVMIFDNLFISFFHVPDIN